MQKLNNNKLGICTQYKIKYNNINNLTYKLELLYNYILSMIKILPLWF